MAKSFFLPSLPLLNHQPHRLKEQQPTKKFEKKFSSNFESETTFVKTKCPKQQLRDDLLPNPIRS
jgi:hypothetical protein